MLPAPLNDFSYLTGVGSKAIIAATIKRLGIRAKGRKIVGDNKSYKLRKLPVS